MVAGAKKYRNTKTGAEFYSPCVVSGPDWEEVKDKAQGKPDKAEEKPEKAAEEKPKKEKKK